MKILPHIEEVVLLVDFNELDENDSLSTYWDFSLGPWKPQEGLWARLVDGEGCSCLGKVKRISGEDVEVVPDWATWVCDAPEWATWSPPGQAAKRAARLRKDLHRPAEQLTEETSLKESPFAKGPTIPV